MALTVGGCVSSLVEMGYSFSLRDDGSVSVKQPAKRNPRGAEMVDFLKLHKLEFRAEVKARQEVQTQLALYPKSDGTGEIHELVGMNAEEAFSLGEFIKEGRGELIGNVIYHKPSGLFDAKVRFLKGWAD